MKTINEHIKKKEFKNAYLIYGPEAYLRNQVKAKLKEALVAADDTMNYSYFEGNKVDINEIISLANTLPFFSEQRLIIMEETNLFKNTTDELIDFIKAGSESTVLVFIEPEVDKRGRLYKAIQKAGYIASMDLLDEKSLRVWIGSLLKKEGKKIMDSSLNLFLEKTGNDMLQIKNELEKLFSYTLNRDEITREDVMAVTSTTTTSKIFDMMTYIANQQQRKALALYNDLLILKEPPMRILALLTRQFNLVMQVKDLERSGQNNAAIGKQTGLPSFVVNKYINQGNRFSMERLMEILRYCAKTEEDVKTGKLNDVIGVELLIVDFSSL